MITKRYDVNITDCTKWDPAVKEEPLNVSSVGRTKSWEDESETILNYRGMRPWQLWLPRLLRLSPCTCFDMRHLSPRLEILVMMDSHYISRLTSSLLLSPNHNQSNLHQACAVVRSTTPNTPRRQPTRTVAGATPLTPPLSSSPLEENIQPPEVGPTSPLGAPISILVWWLSRSGCSKHGSKESKMLAPYCIL